MIGYLNNLLFNCNRLLSGVVLCLLFCGPLCYGLIIGVLSRHEIDAYYVPPGVILLDTIIGPVLDSFDQCTQHHCSQTQDCFELSGFKKLYEIQRI